MDMHAICAEYERRIDSIIPRVITKHDDRIVWLAAYKDYRIQVVFFADGRVSTEYSIPKNAVHYFASDELSETREFKQRWELDIMPVIASTLCALDELRNEYMEDMMSQNTLQSTLT